MITLREIWYMLCTTCRPERSATVRYAFPLMFLAAIFAGATAAVITEESSYIKILAEPESVNAHETFFITVSVVAHTPINAVDIQVKFPELKMEVVGIDTGRSVISLWPVEPYAENGIIYLRGGTLRRGFVGEHEIARIRGVASESGASRIFVESARLVSGDGSGEDVELTDAGQNEVRVYVANEEGSLSGTVTVQLVTDLDGDGDVDLSDISRFMTAWFKKTNIFDFNGDGKMTFRDFSILLADSFFN